MNLPPQNPGWLSLSAAGIGFLGVLFPPRNPALLTVGLPTTTPDR
jgi:hypothetical protein